jgi:hypothetical protein
MKGKLKMTAIPTKYYGIEYRSRLEARWASFFHQIGWETVYEPFDGRNYIPDFLIEGVKPMLVEVKPAVTLEDFRTPIPKIERGLDGLWDKDILIVGASPLPNIISEVCPYLTPMAGLLGEHYAMEMLPSKDAPESGWCWDAGNWAHRCSHGLSVQHAYQSYFSRPCGCYDGSQHDADRKIIAAHWANACNDVKWRSTAA